VQGGNTAPVVKVESHGRHLSSHGTNVNRHGTECLYLQRSALQSTQRNVKLHMLVYSVMLTSPC